MCTDYYIICNLYFEYMLIVFYSKSQRKVDINWNLINEIEHKSRQLVIFDHLAKCYITCMGK